MEDFQNTFGNQTKLEEHVLKYTEQEVCNVYASKRKNKNYLLLYGSRPTNVENCKF